MQLASYSPFSGIVLTLTLVLWLPRLMVSFSVIGGVGVDVMASRHRLGFFGKGNVSMLMVSSSL